jgi:hypothetical protein
MDRINDPTAALNLFGSGKHGFTDGDPVGGIDPTFLNALWFNGVQENPIRVIEAVGIGLDAGNHLQLLQAICRLAGGNTTVISATGVLTADNAGIVSVNAGGGAVTLTLPPANAAAGRPIRFTFVRTDASANTLSIQRAGGDAIEGVVAITVPVGRRVTLQSDGASSWRLVAVGGGLLGVQVFGASSTYVPTPGTGRVRVTAIGGGGAGGGVGVASSGNVSLGAPGGAGTVAQGLYTAAQVGASLAVTVGVGGAPASGSMGGSGGSTSFGALLTCPGGPGGGVSSDTPSPNLNANGSVSSSAIGTVLWQALGGSDGFSFALSASGGAGGPGGRSWFGIGTPPVAFNGAAVAGVSPGAGGSGIAIGSGVGPFPGGAGAAGLVLIEEFAL